MGKIVIWLEKRFDRLKPLTQVILIGAVYAVMQLLVPVLLFDYSEVLGVFWVILLVLYTAILVLSAAYLFYRREIRYLEGMYGTDFVLNAFPKEKKRRERKVARERKKEIEKRDAGIPPKHGARF